ncbi:MAG TPA: F0F1 ATP synthase subunit gamma [Patescibacteria group bacterium]|nr:F0F1 ATP synthase subunit gamma [Patescibacteria group bacterium]
MSNIPEISEEIKSIKSLENLVNAYEEISSIRMKNNRDRVLENRNYQNQINAIFDQVRLSYSQEIERLAKKKGGQKQITFIPHNGKTVAVLLSANAGLYGEVISKTYNLFINDIRNSNSEITIIGRYGLSLYLSEEMGKPYSFFDLPDYGDDLVELGKIVNHVVQYDEIDIYFGEFKNIIKQDPVKLTVSSRIDLSQKPGQVKVAYMFEPSLEKILMYFETQIFASLFQQSVDESRLAKYASRFVAMDRARNNIDIELKKMNFIRNRLVHNIQNRKQLGIMSSVYASSNVK